MQVACITRLVPQKGVHLIRHAIYRTLELGGQFVLLGSSPVPEIQVSLVSQFEILCIYMLLLCSLILLEAENGMCFNMGILIFSEGV